MSNANVYQMIMDAIQQDIHDGRLAVGDVLPSVREMAEQWGCAPGTVQRAYRELAEMGVVISRSGQGTRVAPNSDRRDVRMLKLVNAAESFLLERMGAGYDVFEIERAFALALDGVRVRRNQLPATHTPVLRFVGSHDPALALALTHIAQAYPLEITFAGSMNGLMALAQGQADIAGCHLWDSETHSYNKPFVRRLFHGREMAVLTIAHRRLGLIVLADNPFNVQGLDDLTRDGVRFVNRQDGAGTRVWLDDQLQQRGISAARIVGYEQTVDTHAEVAKTIASGAANVGVGVEAVAKSYGLGFVPLNTEKYDLVIPAETWNSVQVQALVGYLQLDSTRRAIAALGGYSTTETGILDWVS